MASDREGSRVLALVIGNGEYQGLAKLTNATRDAELVSSTLQEIGVDSVVTHFDLSRASMSQAVDGFLRSMKKFDVGVIYYAGHGMQDEYRENYLIPIDYGAGNVGDLFSFAYPLGRMVQGCSRLEGKTFVLFLDACRNNPFQSDYRDASGGLGKPPVPSEGIVIGYSTESGKVAGDYANEDNGLYAKSLCDVLVTPNLKVEDVLKRVGEEVRSTSNRVQNPEWWGNLSGEVILNYDSEQYEIKVSEIQANATSRVDQFVQQCQLFRNYHVGGYTVPEEIANLSYNFMAFRLEHRKKGELRLMRQADLYNLVIEYHKFAYGMPATPLAESVESVFSSGFGLLYRENSSLMQALGLQSPDELKIYLWHIRVAMNQEDVLSQEFLTDFIQDLWNADLTTWYIGTSWLGSVLKEYTSSDIAGMPLSHHFAIVGDSISTFCPEAYPDCGIFPVGRIVNAVTRFNGDTLRDNYSWLDEPVTLHLDSAEKVVLEPRNGFVLNDSIFVETPAANEYRNRLIAAYDVLLEAEASELEYWAGQSDLPPNYSKFFALHPHYIANENWSISVGDQLDYAINHKSCADLVWAKFKSAVDRLRWQYANENLVVEFTLILAWRSFQTSSNQLMFLPEGFITKNKREVRKILTECAELLDNMNFNMKGYAGDFSGTNFEYGSGTSLAGMSWHFAAFTEKFYAIHPEMGFEFIAKVDSLIEHLDLNTINENSAAGSYLIAYLNYAHHKGKRLKAVDRDYPIKALTEVLNKVVYDFRPFEDDAEVSRLIKHGYSTDIGLLSSKNPKVLKIFFWGSGGGHLFTPLVGFYQLRFRQRF